MNASEKTAFIGFKIFSERELKERQAKAVTRRVAGFKKFMGDLLATPNLELGKHMDEKALEAVFRDNVNNFYDYALNEGLTSADLEGIMDDIIQVAFMFKRTMNEASTEVTRLNYALTGENQLTDVPLKDVIKTAQLLKETRPAKPSEYDDEPSLGQSVDEGIKDAEPEAPAA